MTSKVFHSLQFKQSGSNLHSVILEPKAILHSSIAAKHWVTRMAGNTSHHAFSHLPPQPRHLGRLGRGIAVSRRSGPVGAGLARSLYAVLPLCPWRQRIGDDCFITIRCTKSHFQFHLTARLPLTADPLGMGSWVGWLIADALPTKWPFIEPAVRCRTGKVCRRDLRVLTTMLRHRHTEITASSSLAHIGVVGTGDRRMVRGGGLWTDTGS